MRTRQIGLRPAALLRSVGSMLERMGRNNLPINDGVEPLQRVACFREADVAVLKVKQAVLHGVNVVRMSVPILGVVNFLRLRKLGDL